MPSGKKEIKWFASHKHIFLPKIKTCQKQTHKQTKTMLHDIEEIAFSLTKKAVRNVAKIVFVKRKIYRKKMMKNNVRDELSCSSHYCVHRSLHTNTVEQTSFMSLSLTSLDEIVRVTCVSVVFSPLC
jgi:hypothetical protein